MADKPHIPGAEVLDRWIKPVQQVISGLRQKARARVSARLTPLARRMGIPSPQDVSMLRQEIGRLEAMVGRLEQAIDHSREAVQGPGEVEQVRQNVQPESSSKR